MERNIFPYRWRSDIYGIHNEFVSLIMWRCRTCLTNYNSSLHGLNWPTKGHLEKIKISTIHFEEIVVKLCCVSHQTFSNDIFSHQHEYLVQKLIVTLNFQLDYVTGKQSPITKRQEITEILGCDSILHIDLYMQSNMKMSFG